MTARDTIAELIGLVYVPAVRCWYTDLEAEDQHFICADPKHPIPNTLDFVSEAWPDECSNPNVTGRPPDVYGLRSHEDRLERFFDAYLQALVWLRDNDRPAFDAAVEKARRVMKEAR